MVDTDHQTGTPTGYNYHFGKVTIMAKSTLWHSLQGSEVLADRQSSACEDTS